MNNTEFIKNAKRIVVKVGSSTLTHDNGKMNLLRIDRLARTLCDLHNSGRDIVLVSSGAVAAGRGKTGYEQPLDSLPHKQAMAAVGQSELMSLYARMFGEYGNTAAQILLTRDVIDMPVRRSNAQNTFETLMEWGVIPIVNENDTISTEELQFLGFGDNDSLSAMVAELINADLLIILSDIDGLYDSDPKVNEGAKLIPVIDKIDDDVKQLAGGAGSNRGTGGMITKLLAGEIATGAGINMIIMNGEDPYKMYDLLDGESVGTLFTAQ